MPASRSATASTSASASRSTAAPQIGCVCRCLSRVSPLLFTSRSRWIASCGMRSIGPVRTRCVAPSAVTTRPASSSSRSSQEFSSGPPYTSTPACSSPSEFDVGLGFSLNDGESVCAPRMRNGVATPASAGCTHAMTAPSRTTTRRPGVAGHSSASSSSSNPASSRRRATSAAAWYDVGEAWMNAAKSAMYASVSRAGMPPSNTGRDPRAKPRRSGEPHDRLKSRANLHDLGAAEMGRTGQPLAQGAREP